MVNIPTEKYAILYSIYLALMLLVIAPSAIYAIFVIRHDWNTVFFVKRHRVFIVSMIAAMDITLFITIPFEAIESGYFNYPPKIAPYLFLFIHLPCYYMMICLMGCRFWLLYFDIHLTKYNLEKAWLNAMNPNSDKENWFKQKELSLGNPDYVFKRAVFVVSLVSIISIILRLLAIYINDEAIQSNLVSGDRMTQGGFIIIMFFWLLIIFYKLQRSGIVSDQLGIRKEIYIIIILGLTLLLIWFSTLGCAYNGLMSFQMYNLIWCYYCSIYTGVFSLVITIFPRKVDNKSIFICQSSRKKYNHSRKRYKNGKNKNKNKSKNINRKSKTKTNTDIIKTQPNVKPLRSETGSPRTNERMIHNAKNAKLRLWCCCCCGSDADKLDINIATMDQPQMGHKAMSDSVADSIDGSVSISISASSGGALSISSITGRNTTRRRKFGSSWTDIVCTRFGFESLMHHLQNEFSIENLLFITEV